MIFSALRREATPPCARNLASLTMRRRGPAARSRREPPGPLSAPRRDLASRAPPLPTQGSARCSPGLEQPLAQLALVLGSRVEARGIGQLVEAGEAEEPLEQLGGLEDRRAELGAARLLDQAALGQRLHRRLRGDAADARHLRPRDRLQVGDDRQRLGLRLGQRRRARLGQQAPRRLLAGRVAGQREAAGDLAQDDAAPALGEVLAQQLDRLGDLALGRLGRLGQVGDARPAAARGRAAPRSCGARSLMPSASCLRISIGPNGSLCSQVTSPLR